MIRSYRKYFEPQYGPAAPEVCIGQPQIIDPEHPARWQIKNNYETVAAITSAISACCCYDALMSVRIRNTYLERNGMQIPLRIYYPDTKGTHPIMVFYHGGGFSMNNLDVYEYVNRYFAKFGQLTVVAVDYRLAPEHRFPTGLEDAYAALLWTFEHAEELGGTKNNINVCGDSSGGNFAASVSLMARDRKGPTIRKQALIYPLTIIKPDIRLESEIRYGKGYFLEYNSEDDPMALYFENEADRENPYASPLTADSLKDLPPAAFFSAECDPLLDQGLMYAARLEDAGVETEYHLYKGMIHGFLNSTLGKTFEMMNDVCGWIN